MNRAEIISTVARNTKQSRETVDEVFTEVLAVAKKSLESEEKVNLTGIGTLSVRERPSRAGRNPRTGEAITIAAKKVIQFKPSKALADTVNS